MPGGELFTAATFMQMTGATERQVQDIERFQRLLADGNARMNLVGPSAMAEFWSRHAFDSAQLLHVEQGATCWADVGAGGGFPGVVLAILLKGRPGGIVHLIESMAKRAAFLDAVCTELDLPACVHHARSEDVAPMAGLQIVTARACAPLPRLLDYTRRFFASGARGLFLKGATLERELTEARRSWTLQATVLQSRSDPSGRILQIERAAPRGR